MTLSLDTRQRALLQHMGIRLDFLPSPGEPVVGTSVTPVPPQPPLQTSTPTATPDRSRQARPPVPQASVTALAPRSDVSQADWGQLHQTVSDCTACGLCQSRKQTVFGAGTQPDSVQPGVDVMIVGEAPGEQEDKQGMPFVGAAGQLLDQMLMALGLSRQAQGGPQGTVFIANVLKCRPPNNRNPSPQEMAQCWPYLQRQIELARPKVLLALGRFGAQALLADQMPEVETTPMGKLRLTTHRYQDTPLVITFHPAYLLRNPAAKAQVWSDLCLAHSLLKQPEAA